MSKETIISQIEALKNTPLLNLQKQYKALFNGEDIGSYQRSYLQRKIAYKIQDIEYGGLSLKAKNRLKDLIKEYDPINNKVLRPDNPVISQTAPGKDKRIPIPGTMITKNYKGLNHQVKVLEKGFEYNGKLYKTLSAIAKEISGAHWNGYLFFNL